MKRLFYPLILVFCFFTSACETEEPNGDNVNADYSRNLCISFTDPFFSEFSLLEDQTIVLDHLLDMPFYSKAPEDGNGDILEYTFGGLVLVEDYYNALDGQSMLLFHLFYEAGSEVEDLILDCAGNIVTESFLEASEQALDAKFDFETAQVIYSKYHYFQ